MLSKIKLPKALTKKTLIIISSVAACLLIFLCLFFWFKPVKNYNKQSGYYVNLLKKLTDPKIISEEKDEIFSKVVNIYPIIREIYAVDRGIVVEEGENINLPCDYQLAIARKMFIDGHLVDLWDVEDTVIPTGNKIFIRGYNIVPFRKIKSIFNGSLELEEGKHQFRYVLDLKIVKNENKGPGESLYETSFEYSKEFTIINKLPENYITTVSYPDLDKKIGLSLRVGKFEEETLFGQESELEYQTLIFNTNKPSPENIASDIIAVSKRGVLIDKIGTLFVYEGEKLENYKVPIKLTKLGKGNHTIILKIVPNKKLAFQNARMRRIWNGAIKTEITFELRKREVKSMFETPVTEQNKIVQPTTTIKKKGDKTSTTIIKTTTTEETLTTTPTTIETPTTETPSTQPPATLPPATFLPPATQPPATLPPTQP